MPDDELTAREEKWVERLERLIAAMPPRLHIQVHRHHIEVCRPHAVKAYFDAVGDVQSAPSLYTVYHDNLKRFEPVSESI